MSYPVAACRGRTQILSDDAVTLFLDETGLGSAVVAYSVRKLRAAYSGYFVRLRRGSDSKEADFGDDGTGWLTNSSTAANGSDPALDGQSISTFFSGTTGFVVTVYDQSGNANNATQATAGNQVQIIAAGALMTGSGSRPAWDHASSDTLVSVSNTGISGNANLTVYCVLAQDTTTTDSTPWGIGDTAVALHAIGPIGGLTTNGKYSPAYSGGNNFNDSGTYGTGWESLTVVKSAGAINTTTVVYINAIAGSDAGGSSTGTPDLTDEKFRIGVWATGAAFFFDGKMSEIVVYNTAHSSGTVSTGFSNQDAAYVLP